MTLDDGANIQENEKHGDFDDGRATRLGRY